MNSNRIYERYSKQQLSAKKEYFTPKQKKRMRKNYQKNNLTMPWWLVKS